VRPSPVAHRTSGTWHRATGLDYEYAEVLGGSSYEALTQVVTELFETQHIIFDLISGNLFVNLEAGLARGPVLW